MSTSSASPDEVREALAGWRGRDATIILEGREPRQWLARFSATIHALEDESSLQLFDAAAGEPEQWVTVPSYYDHARLETDQLSITWSAGTLIIRLWREEIPDFSDVVA